MRNRLAPAYFSELAFTTRPLETVVATLAFRMALATTACRSGETVGLVLRRLHAVLVSGCVPELDRLDYLAGRCPTTATSRRWLGSQSSKIPVRSIKSSGDYDDHGPPRLRSKR